MLVVVLAAVVVVVLAVVVRSKSMMTNWVVKFVVVVECSRQHCQMVVARELDVLVLVEVE